MNAITSFQGAAKRLDDVDLPRLGSLLGVGEDEVHAIMDVEARGNGFDALGRPAHLFEPHVFYRNLSGAQRDRAVREGLAYPKWKPGTYPKDSYPRLKNAMLINPEAALRSGSWGLFQILGENFAMCGYPSAQAMVRDFLDDEETHLQAMVRFVLAAGLDDELRRHDWVGFARGYNGPNHAKHNYAGRLAKAYDHWSKIPDTEWKRSVAVETAHTVPTPSIVPVLPPDFEPGKAAKPEVTEIKIGPMAWFLGGVSALALAAMNWACKIPFLSSFLDQCGGSP